MSPHLAIALLFIVPCNASSVFACNECVAPQAAHTGANDGSNSGVCNPLLPVAIFAIAAGVISVSMLTLVLYRRWRWRTYVAQLLRAGGTPVGDPLLPYPSGGAEEYYRIHQPSLHHHHHNHGGGYIGLMRMGAPVGVNV
ncbi:hypothetical protein FB451DRAFT_1164859 [Mycena latifolia]|nr:hypothetical protein FB451DRAFT_1164859 [Mycena latifolia]